MRIELTKMPMLNLVKGSSESKLVVTKKYQKLSYCRILLINIIFGKEEVGGSNPLVGSILTQP